MRYTDPIPALKRDLAEALVRALDGYRTTEIMASVKIDQPRISDLRHGRLNRISAERLIRWLGQAGYAVEFRVNKLPGLWIVKLE